MKPARYFITCFTAFLLFISVFPWHAHAATSDGNADISSIYQGAGALSPAFSPASFADAGKVSDWAYNSMANGIQAGIVSGRAAAELAPQAFMTRAEVAVIVQRLLEKSGLI